MKEHKLSNQVEDPSFWKSALAINGSVTPRVLKQVAVIVAYTALIEMLHYFYPTFSLPIAPFEFAGVILGLILVFRVNAGYERWWEARKLWGSVVNQSRNLSIILTHYTENVDYPTLKRLNGYIAALPYLMKNSLRATFSTEKVKHLLDESLCKELSQAEHPPLVLVGHIASEIKHLRAENKLDDFAFLKAEEQRSILVDCQGACERILKTPMPFVMAVKVRRFILLFLLMLPLGFVHISDSACLLISAIVSYGLFSIDQIGVELQNPFSQGHLSHLPLTTICKTIEKNIEEILASTHKE